ncbi:MAG: hypothetical protein JNJ54_25240 [Myxococcaceae bacterium]|nr:hypothetical protein [Myxococcaceae bacterium]
MTNSDLTIQILQGIRSDLQQASRDSAARFEAINDRFEAMNERFEAMNERFEVIETSLRDMAEQFVMQSRAIKAAIEVRANVEKRLDEHEARLSRLEQHHAP